MSRNYLCVFQRLGRILFRVILLLSFSSLCLPDSLAVEHESSHDSPLRSETQSESNKPGKIPSKQVGKESMETLSDDESRQIRILEVFTNAWIFCFGAAVGSFLNVVAYRIPLGMSLIHPPSRCSGCNNRIEFLDNLPILGWLRLRGKCRHCQIPISVRYPLVEALAALLFLIVAHVELLSGGASLPVRESYFYTGVVWILWYTKWDLLGIYLYHMLLISGLLAL